MNRLLVVLLILCLLSVNGYAYGPRGHQLVGAIADRRLKKDQATTKAVAVILLTHYLGDIHQTLHVGAEYFNNAGNPFEPQPNNKGFADQGGNKLTLFTFVHGRRVSAGKFHSYWDTQAVNNAFGNAQDATVAKRLAANEPDAWQLSGGIETWAEKLANEII